MEESRAPEENEAPRRVEPDRTFVWPTEEEVDAIVSKPLPPYIDLSELFERDDAAYEEDRELDEVWDEWIRKMNDGHSDTDQQFDETRASSPRNEFETTRSPSRSPPPPMPQSAVGRVHAYPTENLASSPM